MSKRYLVAALASAVILVGGCQDQVATEPDETAFVPSGPSEAVIWRAWDVPFEQVFEGCGEEVYAQGLDHWVLRSTDAPSGMMHWGFSNNWTATAEGLSSGYVWDARGNNNLMLVNAGDLSPLVFTWMRISRFKGREDASDFTVRSQEHVTVNANGDITSTRLVDEVICE